MQFSSTNPSADGAQNLGEQILGDEFPTEPFETTVDPMNPSIPSVDDIMASVDEIPSVDDLMSSVDTCLLYTSPSPRDATLSRMPSSA